MPSSPPVPPGRLILLNGASSAGKSTLCHAIQTRIDEPFLQFSLDFLMFGARVLPRRDPEGPFSWAEMRPRLFEGYYRCLPAFLGAGNNLVVDYIIETPEQWRRLVELLRPFDVFLVGVHCPLDELERRERARGDRHLGDARRDLLTVHTFTRYDFEVDSRRPPEENSERIIAAWHLRRWPGVLGRLS
ncbi:chloramphenicol phosphotransferase CPT family protein [Deinococcus aetherius]|uniref:chloramphenicol phosphotransferase CPT family protein n=1 Tax=Deinococcus aetherius TaxID=200252 RepID=UPI002230C913|nr:chloramphenicol phosphotransferase CPT family protein [Deinococcus aetherius]